MFCASCERETRLTPCERCGKDPLLDGRYCLQALVQRGAHGRTWRAFHGAQRYAVKEFTLGSGSVESYDEVVRHEITQLTRLDHRGVSRYREGMVARMGATQSLFLVQDYVDGHTLAEELGAGKRIEVVQVLEILEELAGTLIYLHGLTPPVIHRDIHPGNVLRRDDDDTLVLIDFAGIRDVLRDLDGRAGAGSEGYAAPEQQKGRVSPVCDLYSLGALAVRMLTGLEPSTLLDHNQQLRWADHCDAAASVQWLIQGLVEPNPAKRVRNAQELLLRLRTVRGPKGTTSRRALSRTDAPSLSGRAKTADHEPHRPGFFDEQPPVGQPLHEAKTVLAHVKSKPAPEDAETELDLDDDDHLSGFSDPNATRADNPEPDEDDSLDRMLSRRRDPPPKAEVPKPPNSGLGSAPPLSALPSWAALPVEPADPDEEPTIIASRYTTDPAIAMITGATLVAEDDDEIELDEPPRSAPVPPPPRETSTRRPQALRTIPPPSDAFRVPNRAVPPPPAGVKSVTIPPPEPKLTTIPPAEDRRPRSKGRTNPPPEPAPKAKAPPIAKELVRGRTRPPEAPAGEPAKGRTTPPAGAQPAPVPGLTKAPPRSQPVEIPGLDRAPSRPSAADPLFATEEPVQPAAKAPAEARPTPPKIAELRPNEPRPVEPKAAEPRAAEPKAAEPRAAEPRPAETTGKRAPEPPPIAAFAPPPNFGLEGLTARTPAPPKETPKEPTSARGVFGLGLEPRPNRTPSASISADPRSGRSGPVPGPKSAPVPEVRERPAPPPEIREKSASPPEIRESVPPAFEVRESGWTAPPPQESRDDRSSLVDDYFHKPIQPARTARREPEGDSVVSDWRAEEMIRPPRRTLGEESPVKAPSKKKRKKKRPFSTASLGLFVVLATILALVIAALLTGGE